MRLNINTSIKHQIFCKKFELFNKYTHTNVMNISKILFVTAFLSTSTLWAEPNEYLEVEDSPTSMAALFDDTAVFDDIEAKPLKTTLPSAEETTMTVFVEIPQIKKASRGIAAASTYDCTGVEARITKGVSITKKEMAAYQKLCK